MEKVTRLLNLPIDVPQRMAIARDGRQVTRRIRQDLAKDPSIQGLPIDFVPITVSNVVFSYDGTKRQSITHFGCGLLHVEQGQLVSLVGHAGQGKSTLLKILGAVELPEPGGFFIPSHLRVLHVSAEPFFFIGSLYDNLIFGVNPGDPDGSLERVQAICDKLGVSDEVKQYVRMGPDGERRMWLDVLSHSQKCLCMIARALAANPELLCIHKPTMAFDETTSKRVLRLLREFVEAKGVEQDASTRHCRRPRTCITTSSKFLGIEAADVVFTVTREAGIQAIEKHLITPEMLM